MSVNRMRSVSFLAMGLLAIAACGPVGPGSGDNNNNNNNNATGTCGEGERRCSFSTVEVCTGGAWVTETTCTDPTPYCADAAPGCVVCPPGQTYCDGPSAIRSCDSLGNPGAVVAQCQGGETCSAGICTSPCIQAEASNSYIGCDYWAVPTANGLIDPIFDNNFGVVVSNANDTMATVTVERAGNVVATQDVPANTVAEFQLAIDTGLQGDGVTFNSVQVADAAYHVTSTLPVTVYQFSPFDFEIGGTTSFSNDASLVLPRHVLSTNYIVMSRPTFGVEQCDPFFGCGGWTFLPGFLTIVGTEAGTQVTVTSSAFTQPGSVGALSPGGTSTFTIGPGEAIQLRSQVPTTCTGQTAVNDCNQPGAGVTCNYCDFGPQYDLTGTVISSSAPVAVFSGHECSFIPFDTWACDHLEEQMLPLETWGKEFVIGRTEPQFDPTFTASPEPNVIRILSGADANTIAFDPPQAPGAQVTLNQGEYLEFQTSGDFEIIASEALAVAQYVVGQNFYTANLAYHGDPAYALMVPSEQFRNEYSFLAPSTMTFNFVNITKRVGEGSATVYLDGAPLPESDFGPPVGTSGYGVARIPISGTSHTVDSSEPFGIVVYGFATYTSYMYPGGLDLNFINPVD